MLWQVAFDYSFDRTVELEQQLQQLGIDNLTCLPATTEQPEYQTDPGDQPRWSQCQVELYLDEQQLDRLLLAIASNRLDGVDAQLLTIKAVHQQDWQNRWKEYWQPTRHHKLIVASHLARPPTANPGDTIIYINPGLAFGTGTHETTALCLEWLSLSQPTGLSILDYGCGSGILALAAAALGNNQVTAYDHDRQAIQATRANSDLNELESLCIIDSPDRLAIKGGYKVILANIMLTPLITLRDELFGLLSDDGTIVVSGILDHQQQQLNREWQQHFDLNERRQRNEWLLISFTKINRKKYKVK